MRVEMHHPNRAHERVLRVSDDQGAYETQHVVDPPDNSGSHDWFFQQPVGTASDD